MCIGPGEIPLVQRPEPSASKMQLNTQKSYSESPTRDLDDIVSCYIHSPMSDSVLNSPDDILLHIQAFHDAIWKSYTIKQNSATLSNPSVVVKPLPFRDSKGKSPRPRQPSMGVDSCVDDVDNLLVPSDDGFSSSEEFPSRSSDPYVTGPNPYFGDTEEAQDISTSVGLLRRKSHNRSKGLHKQKTSDCSTGSSCSESTPRLINVEKGPGVVLGYRAYGTFLEG